MAKDRTQLNINIDPELLISLKSQAIKSGKTLTEFITERLKNCQNIGCLEEKIFLIKNLIKPKILF